MDVLTSKKDKLATSLSKQAVRLDHAVARMRRCIHCLLSHSLHTIIIPPFEVSGMIGHAQMKITPPDALLGVVIQTRHTHQRHVVHVEICRSKVYNCRGAREIFLRALLDGGLGSLTRAMQEIVALFR